MEELTPVLARAQDGDLDAFGELVKRFQDMAVFYAYSVLGDFHLAEDAAQDAFIESYLHVSKVYGAPAFPAWLRKIVFKHCDRILRRKRLAVSSLEETGEIPVVETPAALIEEKETRMQVHAALRTLPDREREVATLFYIGEYTHKEIGAFLDVPATTVNNRLHAARRWLREEFVNMTKEDLKTRRPSRDEEFVKEVLQPLFYKEELRALERLHDRLVSLLSATFSEVAGKKAEVTVGFVDQTYYAEVVSALAYYPTGTYSFNMAPLPGRAFFNMSTPSFFTLLGDEQEDVRRLAPEEAGELWGRDRVLAHRARALRQLTVEQIEEFHPAALKILHDIERAWSPKQIRLKDIEVTTSGPSLSWTSEGQLEPAGFAPPDEIVALIGLDVTIEGYDSDDLNPGGPRPHFPAIQLCYPLSTLAAIRPLTELV